MCAPPERDRVYHKFSLYEVVNFLYIIHIMHQEVQVSRCWNLCDDFSTLSWLLLYNFLTLKFLTATLFFHNATTWIKICSLCSVNFNIYVAFSTSCIYLHCIQSGNRKNETLSAIHIIHVSQSVILMSCMWPRSQLTEIKKKK